MKYLILILAVLFIFNIHSQVCFAPPVANNFAVGQNNRAVITDDFNNDGKPDMVANNYSSNSISVLLGNGLGGILMHQS